MSDYEILPRQKHIEDQSLQHGIDEQIPLYECVNQLELQSAGFPQVPWRDQQDPRSSCSLCESGRLCMNMAKLTMIQSSLNGAVSGINVSTKQG